MKKRIPAAVSLVACISIPLLVLLVHLKTSPRFLPLSPDSSVFAYAGKLVTEGQLPYRDFWDHKPPLIYYMDALAISLVGPTPWAIWWLDVIYLSITGIVYYFLLKKLLSSIPALVASWLFLLTLMVSNIYLGGNLTETYGLLPQGLLIGSMFCFFKTKKIAWVLVAGLAISIASLFKQTIIGLGLGALLSILILGVLTRQYRRMLVQVTAFGTGFFLPWIIVTTIWIANGAFTQFWDAVFAYNLVYVHNSFSIDSIYKVYKRLLIDFPLLPIVVISVASFCMFLQSTKPWLFRPVRDKQNIIRLDGDEFTIQKVFLVVFGAIPFEIALIALGGRDYGHYYLSILPALTFACGYAFETTIQGLRAKTVVQAGNLGFIAILLIAWAVPTYSDVHPQRQHLESISRLGDPSLAQDDLISYIEEHTQPGDPIIVWQAMPYTNFAADRPAPSKYFYYLPLLVETGGRASRFEDFLQDIRADQPTLIVFRIDDPTNPANDTPPELLCQSCIPEALHGLTEFRSFVLAHYRVIDEIDDWTIYHIN